MCAGTTATGAFGPSPVGISRITPVQVHDINVLDLLTPEPGAFYVMDRGSLDFERLYRWTLAGAFFVTRARKNLRFVRLGSHPVDTPRVQSIRTYALGTPREHRSE